MAKESNVLHQVLGKSWKLHEEQKANLLDQAKFFHEWLYEALTAAEESVNCNIACTFPKTPSVKRRKIEEAAPEPEQTLAEDTVEQVEDLDIKEAKKPRKLKRTTNNAKRRPSKDRASRIGATRTRASNKPQPVDLNSSTRVTRASTRRAKLNESQMNFMQETSIYKENENSSDHASNTTKSFIEHEADLDRNETNKAEVVDVQVTHDSQLERIKSEKIAAKEAEIRPKLTEEGSTSKTEKASADVERFKETRLNSTFDFGHSQETSCARAAISETVKPKECCPSKDVARETEVGQREDVTEKFVAAKNKAVNEACKDKSEEQGVTRQITEEQEKNDVEDSTVSKTTKEATQSNAVPHVQIARIKERLFEKIKEPSRPTTPTRFSPRLGKSPARLGNTPGKLDSPAAKKKMITQPIFDDETDDESTVKVSTPKEQKCDGSKGVAAEKKKRNMEHDENGYSAEKDENSEESENTDSDGAVKRTGPKIAKPVKPKNILSGVHSMIKSANQKNNVIHQGPTAKQGNLVTGLFSFIKSNAPAKAETVQERKQRMEEDVRKREEARKKLVEQAELRRQKEVEERKKRRQEREQRVADAQAKKAQEEEARIKIAQERYLLLKKNEERARKNKEKEEEMKRRMRERKMAEAEAKRRNEEIERQAKMAEKEEEERKKQEYLQRRQEYEEQERKRKIEEQKRIEEQRLEDHARDLQLQEERIRKEIEDREAVVRKRLEEKAQKEKEEREIKELQEKRRLDKEAREREIREREEHDKARREREEQEKIRKEKEDKEKALREIREKARKDEEAKEKERKLRELKEKELKEREAYYKKKLEQKQHGEVKRTFDKTELEMKKPNVLKSPTHPAPHPAHQPQKVQCTSYKTPTLTKVKSKIKNKSPSLQSYDIENLSEDDSTDDEEDPAQEIPSWAKGNGLKTAIVQQLKSDIDPYEIFVDMLEPPKLEKMFPKLRVRFFKRTSSACWDHPPRPFQTML